MEFKDLTDLPSQSKIKSDISGFYVSDDKELYFENKFLRSPLKFLLEHYMYQNYRFPTVCRKENLEKEKTLLGETLKSYEIEKEDLCLKGTSQTVAYPMIASNKSLTLPFRWYQMGSVFRPQSSEVRRYFRQKEISCFVQSHGHFSTFKQAKKEFYSMSLLLDHYFSYLELTPFIKKVLRPSNDRFHGSLHTLAYDLVLPDGKVTQVATIHYYGENFSEVYEENPRRHTVTMGISERVLGALQSVCKEVYRRGEIQNIPFFKDYFFQSRYHSNSKILVIAKEDLYEEEKFKQLWDLYHDSKKKQLLQKRSESSNVVLSEKQSEYFDYALTPEKKNLLKVQLQTLIQNAVASEHEATCKDKDHNHAKSPRIPIELQTLKAFNSKDMSRVESGHFPLYTIKVGSFEEIKTGLTAKNYKTRKQITLSELVKKLYDTDVNYYKSETGKTSEDLIKELRNECFGKVTDKDFSGRVLTKDSELVDTLESLECPKLTVGDGNEN